MIDCTHFQPNQNHPFFLIAGPCVIESESMSFDVASYLKGICFDLNIPLIFKSSYDKANRSGGKSYRGLGMENGLEILAKIRKELDIPVLTDVHRENDVATVAHVVDVLQTPAFLCRQTDFIQACAKTGKPINIKKGQFISPYEMKYVIDKARAAAITTDSNKHLFWACERGTSFGYNNLVVDMRSLTIMRENKVPIVFDATHAVQLPGAQGHASGGQREFVPSLARAAVAIGIEGLFLETHPNPDYALSDGPNSIKLSEMRSLLEQLVEIDYITKQRKLSNSV